jgi:hypothetical protein
VSPWECVLPRRERLSASARRAGHAQHGGEGGVGVGDEMSGEDVAKCTEWLGEVFTMDDQDFFSYPVDLSQIADYKSVRREGREREGQRHPYKAPGTDVCVCCFVVLLCVCVLCMLCYVLSVCECCVWVLYRHHNHV